MSALSWGTPYHKVTETCRCFFPETDEARKYLTFLQPSRRQISWVSFSFVCGPSLRWKSRLGCKQEQSAHSMSRPVSLINGPCPMSYTKGVVLRNSSRIVWRQRLNKGTDHCENSILLTGRSSSVQSANRILSVPLPLTQTENLWLVRVPMRQRSSSPQPHP